MRRAAHGGGPSAAAAFRRALCPDHCTPISTKGRSRPGYLNVYETPAARGSAFVSMARGRMEDPTVVVVDDGKLAENNVARRPSADLSRGNARHLGTRSVHAGNDDDLGFAADRLFAASAR